jgi:hypothetical protein
MLSELSIKTRSCHAGRAGAQPSMWEPRKRRTVAGGATEAETDSAVAFDDTLWAANRWWDGLSWICAAWTEIAESGQSAQPNSLAPNSGRGTHEQRALEQRRKRTR